MSILEVHDVSIRYMTGDFKDIGLKEYVVRKLKNDYHVNEFWADKNVSFTLEKGDMLGIIGTNGAGKSTLLKAVSGIMEPTTGYVKREGSIAALLELASGFDGDLTVRENTYLRGAMLGYTRKFMDEMYDQIIEFAELKDFQDRPFKQLSSGMKSRLAFSIASLVQPDILILDEVLSVGDGAFRKKSESKMREIIDGGATTILVSHSITQVRELCTKILWLHKGEQIAYGDDVQRICDRYQEYLDHAIGIEEAKTALSDRKNQDNAARKSTDSGHILQLPDGSDSSEKEHTEVNRGTFSKESSLATKGIAILMMIWHHCFLSGRFEKFTVNFWPLTQSQVVNVAAFFKICVSLFAFVSGYGLWLSYKKARGNNQCISKWICERLIQTLSNYWFVVLLSWIVCMAIDGLPYRAYGFETSAYLGIWNMFVEFLGLTNLFGGAPMDSTWWYMSAAVAFIVLLPAVDALFEKIGCFSAIAAILIFPRLCGGYPGGINFLTFLPVFCFGMIFAKQDLFASWNRVWAWADRPWRIAAKYGLLFLALGISYKVSYFLPTKGWWDVKYNLVPVLVILVFYEILCVIPPLQTVLAFLGKHATNIFLVHTFIRYYYCETFTYTRGHFIAIMVCLLLISLIISVFIESLKKTVKWKSLIEKLINVCITPRSY